MNFFKTLLIGLLYLSINNFLIGKSHFIYAPNLYSNSDYHLMNIGNKTHEKTGILDFRTFSEKSLMNGATFGLNIKSSIFNSLGPIYVLSPIIFFKNNYLDITIQSNAVDEKFGFELLSTKFSRSDIALDYNVAYIEYHNKKSNLSLSIGRSPIWWGQTFSSTLIINPFSGPYDHIYYKQRLNNNFKLEAFSSQLNSKLLNEDIYNRFLSGHKLSYQSIDQRLFLNFGELFIYTGQNKSIDLRFLNPVIPYFIVDINKDDVGNDNSNSILFFDMRYNLSDKISMYFELLIDDYQIDDTGIKNALGTKIGCDYEYLIFNRDINFRLEKNILNDEIYSHSGIHSYYLHNQRPVGFQFGQACNTTNFDINIQLNEYNYFKCSLIELVRNKPSNINKWSYSNDYYNDIYFTEESSLIRKFLFYDLGFIFNYKNIFIDVGISNTPLFNYNIDGQLKMPVERLYLGMQYYFDFSNKNNND